MRFRKLLSLLCLTSLCACSLSKNMKTHQKNKYVVINDEGQSEMIRQILKTQAEAYSFPLSKEDLESIGVLEQAFDNEEKIAGLAAPQIGIKKQAIIFHAPQEIAKWRADLTEVVPKTIWLNPHYEGIGDEHTEDYEGCFSVNDLAGEVPRFRKVKYEAYLIDGTKVQGIAEGYFARVIQHEVDHIRGILFIDKISEERLFSIKEYYRMRDAKIDAAGK